ncbi:hypothetical protein Rhopal_003945-T1 [Rhodotorula paludigena]|uniref:Uncharacterized protein n=1 Tax=Rhodotorula paludigena TaxID=86838 RepID=A0AAV5GED9_9BASI|nr:hypothetical protein Rhopal_003945-T1 [Rhodotorula paludigena]
MGADAILSWYDTNSGRDSTNGNSWCGFPYDNSVPGFAPSLNTMLANFDGDYESAAKAYCGLEAEITTPDGRTVTLYVADAFDDTWVRTPASLDIIHGSFESLYGSYTDNKNNVVKNASWRFTGRRNERLTFKSTDSLGGWATPDSPASTMTSTTSIPTTVQTSATDTAPTPSSSANALTQAGISGFLGNNTNAILSWYDTNSGRDSTNGNSWCGFPYSNDLPGFAPSLRTMLSNFNYDYETAARAYCGLEAVITTPDGRTATMYIADAFDDTWVITPSSLDIIHGSFAQLYGSWTDNKLDVVKNAHWQLTGRRNARLTFKSKNSLGGWS